MLPGEDIVERGKADLHAGIASAEAFAVALFAPRLAPLGINLPPSLPAEPKQRLYEWLGKDLVDNDAHGRTNALLRRVISYAQALEREQGRRIRASRGE